MHCTAWVSGNLQVAASPGMFGNRSCLRCQHAALRLVAACLLLWQPLHLASVIADQPVYWNRLAAQHVPEYYPAA